MTAKGTFVLFLQPAAEVPDVTSVQHNVKLPRRNVLKVSVMFVLYLKYIL